MTKIQRLAKLLKNKKARIVGITNHNNNRYYSLENFDNFQNEFVRVDARPSWENKKNYWINAADLKHIYG
jgi:hypothetical protein